MAVAVGVVAERRGAPVPEAALGAGLHGDARAVGGLLALQFGEHQDELEHGPADGLGGIEGLVERHELDVLGLEGAVQLVEVEQRAGEAVEPGDHHHVELPRGHGGEHLLELRAVEVLAAGALFAEDARNEVRRLARGDGGAEAGLLRLQRALVAELVVGGDAGVEADAEGVGGGGSGVLARNGWRHVCNSGIGTSLADAEPWRYGVAGRFHGGFMGV